MGPTSTPVLPPKLATPPHLGIRSSDSAPTFEWRGDNPATPVNLQVLHFIHATGGSFATTLDVAVTALVACAQLPEGTSRIFHIADRSTWSLAKAAGSYTTSTRDQVLDEVGFIHCSFQRQLLATAARFYGDVDEARYTVLVIDPELLRAPLIVEAAGNGEGFPHIYGPLNTDAVVAAIALKREDGSFALGAAERS